MLANIKNLAEIRVDNIEEIRECILRVGKYIHDHKRILYGGMAIHLALKLRGEELYGPEVLNDFDYYHPNPVQEASELRAQLQMENTNVINALHLTTRRVRLDFTTIADVSLYPEPYYSNIPTMYHQYVFVHPYFQMIDIYKSISHMVSDYLNHRLKKDLKRLNLLRTHYRFQRMPVTPIDTTDLLLSELKEMKVRPERFFGKGYCFTGIYALKKIYKHYIGKELHIKDDIIELLTNEILRGPGYESTCDILPPAVCRDGAIIYAHHGERTISLIIDGDHYTHVPFLASMFLFKYFMLGGKYYECFKACEELMPLIQIDSYYGDELLPLHWVFSERREDCAFKHIPYEPRPPLEYDEQLTDIDIEYETYNIRGKRTQNVEINGRCGKKK